jgi:hypothetical protein
MSQVLSVRNLVYRAVSKLSGVPMDDISDSDKIAEDLGIGGWPHGIKQFDVLIDLLTEKCEIPISSKVQARALDQLVRDKRKDIRKFPGTVKGLIEFVEELCLQI